MPRRQIESLSPGEIHVGQRFDDPRPDAQTLIVRQRHQATQSPFALGGDYWQYGAERDWLFLPHGEITSRTERQLTGQIVMTRKGVPRTAAATDERKPNRRPPKSPPNQPPRGHVEHPVGLEPRGHVVVTRHGDEATGRTSGTNRLGDRRRTRARHVAIDDTREFIEGDDRPRCRRWRRGENFGTTADGKGACQIATKALATTQHVIGLDPGGGRTESHSREQTGDLLDWQFPHPIHDRAIQRPIARCVERFAKSAPRDRALATSRGAHDEADFPGVVRAGHFDREALRGLFGPWKIEHAGHLLDAE